MNKLFLLLVGALITGFMVSSAMANSVEMDGDIVGIGVDGHDYATSNSCRHKRLGSKCTYVADEVRHYGKCEHGDGRRLECIVEYYPS